MTDDQDSPGEEGLPGILSAPRSLHSGGDGGGRDEPPSDAADRDEEAFALVGNEQRMGIVRALGDFEREAGASETLSFSSLRERSDLDLGSSQFNYHLQQLVGRFVEKRDDGYRIRPEGKTLYRAVKAGTFTRRDALDALDLEQDCYHCESSLEAAYQDGMFTIQCRGCETLYDLTVSPPSAVADDEDIRYRLDQYNRHLRLAFVRGVCPTCMHGLDSTFVRPAETGFGDAVRREVYVYRSCDHCGNHSYLSVGSLLLHHPALVSFCHRRGLDVTTTPRWELEFAATDRDVTVRSTDPWELALELSLEGDTLELVVDDSCTVVESTVDRGR